MKSNGEMQI